MKKHAIIFVGIQASGKTTFYNNKLKPLGYCLVSMDILHNRNKEQLELDKLIAEGKPIAIDNTNPTQSDRARYLPKLKDAGYIVDCYYFQSRIRDCIRRNKGRNNCVPDNAIAATSNKLELPSGKEGFNGLFYISIGPEGFDISQFIQEEERK